MNTRIKLEIESLCRAAPEVEHCGFCVLEHDGPRLVVVPNVSSTPRASFVIAQSDWLAAHARGQVLWTWHSHPTANGGFSPADLDEAEESCLRHRLFEVTTNQWYEHRPASYVPPPLEGRRWAWGEQDCASLVRDYYRQHLNLDILDDDRDEPDSGAPMARLVWEGLQREGFQKTISRCTLQKHDLLVMKTNGSPQHAVIFVGNSRVLHHPLMGLSQVALYSGGWQRRLAYVARHKTLAR